MMIKICPIVIAICGFVILFGGYLTVQAPDGTPLLSQTNGSQLTRMGAHIMEM